jgi:hypothetical protein
MPNRSYYAVPVIASGLLAGLPASLCCCSALLTPFASLLAIYLVRRRSAGQPIETGEGAIVGCLVGAVTAVVATALQLAIRSMLEDVLVQFQAQAGRMSFSSGEGLVGLAIGVAIALVLHVAAGVLGGALSTIVLKTGAVAGAQNPY